MHAGWVGWTAPEHDVVADATQNEQRADTTGGNDRTDGETEQQAEQGEALAQPGTTIAVRG